MIILHSYYSLRFGVLSPEELAALAVDRGIDMPVLTDINNTSGVFEFVKACRGRGISPRVGIEFRNDNRWLYTGVALNFKGFGELNRFLSYYRLRGEPLPDRPPAFRDAVVVWPWGSQAPWELGEQEYVGIRHFQLRQLVTSPWRYRQEKLIIWQPAVFADRWGMELHRHLRAIDRNTLLDRVEGHGQSLLQVSSEIRGNLDPGWKKQLGTLLFRILPAGSISGAPKKKTVEIIRRAEQAGRGYFTGVFGYFDGENLDSGVMIRYMEKTPAGLQFRSGGGITGHSDARTEYDELIQKVYVPIV